MGRRIDRRAICLAAVYLAAGCSSRATPIVLADAGMGEVQTSARGRVTLSGTVCVEDAEDLAFPVKVAVLVESTQKMNVIDPLDPLTDKTRRRQALEELVETHLYQGVEFALLAMSKGSKVLTRREDGSEGFTQDSSQLESLMPLLDTANGKGSLLNGLTSVEALVAADMAHQRRSAPVASGRSKYVVVLITGSLPEPGDDFLAQLAQLKGLASSFPGPEIFVHFVFLAGSAPPWPDAAARELYQKAAIIGEGAYVEVGTGEQIQLDPISLRSRRSALELINFLASNTNMRPDNGEQRVDRDGDGLEDGLEQRLGTDLALRDSDGDGFSDGLEHAFGLIPFEPDDGCTLTEFDGDLDGALDDRDGDGLLDCEEVLLGTDPLLVDSDGDASPDSIEFFAGSSPVVSDAEQDSDFDGHSDGAELRHHTSIRSSDDGKEGYRYIITRIGESPACYRYLVENIQLVPIPGFSNRIHLYLDQVPDVSLADHGSFKVGCVEILTPDQPSVHATEKVHIPPDTWQSPAQGWELQCLER